MAVKIMLMIKNDPNQLDYEVQTAIKAVLFKDPNQLDYEVRH